MIFCHLFRCRAIFEESRRLEITNLNFGFFNNVRMNLLILEFRWILQQAIFTCHLESAIIFWGWFLFIEAFWSIAIMFENGLFISFDRNLTIGKGFVVVNTSFSSFRRSTPKWKGNTSHVVVYFYFQRRWRCLVSVSPVRAFCSTWDAWCIKWTSTLMVFATTDKNALFL